MGDAAAGGDAQNATLTAVLNQLWGEQRCGVDTPALLDVDIGPTAMHKWAATQLSKAGVGVLHWMIPMQQPPQLTTAQSRFGPRNPI